MNIFPAPVIESALLFIMGITSCEGTSPETYNSKWQIANVTVIVKSFY